jgi:hypothetical protein
MSPEIGTELGTIISSEMGSEAGFETGIEIGSEISTEIGRRKGRVGGKEGVPLCSAGAWASPSGWGPSLNSISVVGVGVFGTVVRRQREGEGGMKVVRGMEGLRAE